MKQILLSVLTVACVVASSAAQPYCLAEQRYALESRQNRYETHWICTGDTLETFTCEEGTFFLVNGFWITCYEITQDLFKYVTGKNPSKVEGELLPVTNISFADADTFCTKLSNRLGVHWTIPTEQQWRFAYKGGLFSEGYRFSGSNRRNLVAWSSDNSLGIPHVGGQRICNELELYDMDGNVAEMVVCGDSIGFIGGNYLSDITSQGGDCEKDTPPECRGLRIVCRQALWFNTNEEKVYENAINQMKNKN